MSEEQIARLVTVAVQAVLRELRGAAAPAGPLVRVLIGSVTAGLDQALASLALLDDCRFEAVLLDTDDQPTTADHVRELLPSAAVTVASQAGCPRAHAAAAEALVVAALDRATLVRTVVTIPEGFGPKWLLEGLLLGKPVLVSRDSADVTAPAAAPQLRAALAAPLATLESFGAEVVPAVELGPALRAALAVGWRNAGAEDRVLVTEADVAAAEGPIIVPAAAIITPLAWDAARERGVVIQRLPR